MGDHDDWDFDGDEGPPQEFAAEAAAPAPLPRDADGKIVRADWSGGPPPPTPDPDYEPPYDPNAEGRAIVAEVNGDAPGSFDELPKVSQTLFRNQEGYDTVQASVDKVRAHFGDAFAEMDSEFEELPTDAQMVVGALLSYDWTQRGAEALGDALDQLMDQLPLTSEAELREFLVDHGFIEGE